VTAEEFITVGQLGRPRGTTGEIYVTLLTDFPERFENMTEIFVSSGNSWEKMKVLSSRFIAGRPVLQLENINSPEEAARMTNRYLAVPKSQLMKPREDSFFIFDLIGCEVVNESGDRIGSIVDVDELPANDAYIVKTEDGKRLIMAAVKRFVKKVDIENRKVVVDAAGLIEE